jgi:hypothetical protein
MGGSSNRQTCEASLSGAFGPLVRDLPASVVHPIYERALLLPERSLDTTNKRA